MSNNISIAFFIVFLGIFRKCLSLASCYFISIISVELLKFILRFVEFHHINGWLNFWQQLPIAS